MDAVLQDAVEPLTEPLGFLRVSGRRWVRGSFAPIRHVLEVQSMKGNTCSPRWYVSLDFVPHVTGARLGYHRTNRSVRADLVLDPWDQVDLSDRSALQPWIVTTAQEADAVWAAASNMAAWAVPRAEEWLSPLTDVARLPAAFERAAALPVHRFGVDQHVQQRLAWAFSSAAAGDASAAHGHLELWLQRAGEGLADELVGELRRRLDALARH